jgi:hypothetical protein
MLSFSFLFLFLLADFSLQVTQLIQISEVLNLKFKSVILLQVLNVSPDDEVLEQLKMQTLLCDLSSSK